MWFFYCFSEGCNCRSEHLVIKPLYSIPTAFSLLLQNTDPSYGTPAFDQQLALFSDFVRSITRPVAPLSHSALACFSYPMLYPRIRNTPSSPLVWQQSSQERGTVRLTLQKLHEAKTRMKKGGKEVMNPSDSSRPKKIGDLPPTLHHT